MKKLIQSVLLGGLTLGVAQATVAAPDEGISLYLGGGGFFYDSDRDIDDTEILEGGIGVIVNERITLEAIIANLGSSDTVIPGIDADGDLFRVDGLYHLEERDTWQPYFAGGMGLLEVSTDSGDSDETIVNLGGGIKKYLSPAWSLRGDLRGYYGLNENNFDTALTVGLNYIFGASSSAAPVASTPVVGDSDGDGVNDNTDQCPDTPSGVAVDSVGCALDSDGDGVPNYKDECPDTPAGARVDEKGCQYVIKETVEVELEVLFDTNKSEVKPEFVAEIQRVAEFMKLFPATSGVVEGHTDSMGDADYNQQLSQKRADSVRAVLIEKHGIAADRLTAKGFGESDPRADNDTAEGRQQNRRVVTVIKTEVEKTAE